MIVVARARGGPAGRWGGAALCEDRLNSFK